MSETPETDATANPLWGYAQELCLLRDLCRKLERERDEARADCERLNRLLRVETALGQGEIDHWAALERERDEALHDATQQTIKVSLIKSRWIAARQALESIAEGTRCRECNGEDQARLAREGLEASK